MMAMAICCAQNLINKEKCEKQPNSHQKKIVKLFRAKTEFDGQKRKSVNPVIFICKFIQNVNISNAAHFTWEEQFFSSNVELQIGFFVMESERIYSFAKCASNKMEIK